MASLEVHSIGDHPVLRELIAKFAQADACWFASVRPDGRAHLAPIWHVVHDHRIYVITQDRSVRAQNVRRHDYVSLSLADTSNALIIEGVARRAPQLRPNLRDAFQAKYDWDIEADAEYDLVLEVTPRKVMAWGSHGDGRWHFT